MAEAFKDLLSVQERGGEMVSWEVGNSRGRGSGEGGKKGEEVGKERQGRGGSQSPPPSAGSFGWGSDGNPASPQRWPERVHPLAC